MRCLVLAQACRLAGCTPSFLSAHPAEAFQDRLKKENVILHALKSAPYGKDDALETRRMADDAWIIVDGYTFDAAYLTALKKNGGRILAIDDFVHADHYACDVILNQNVYAAREMYAGKTDATLLLGTRYALLHPEFAAAKKGRPVPDVACKVLVTLGGADVDNVTRTVINALAALEDLEMKVIIGGANPNRVSVETACSCAEMDLIVDTTEMHALMAWADMAISAGGTTCYELACMGVPMLTIILAENQRAVAEGMEKAGASINLGWHGNLPAQAIEQAVGKLSQDQKKRNRMARTGEVLVDGYGAPRVCRVLQNTPVWLRGAKADDCKTVFVWANDPGARAASFSSDPIPWEDHVRWFEAKLADPAHHFFIGHDEADRPVGQVRFVREGTKAVVSVSVAPEARGKGWGTALITAGCRRMFADPSLATIEAFIRPENAASQAVFKKAGFSAPKQAEIHGQPALRCQVGRATLGA